jgi:hypothetical protein
LLRKGSSPLKQRWTNDVHALHSFLIGLAKETHVENLTPNQILDAQQKTKTRSNEYYMLDYRGLGGRSSPIRPCP